MKVILITGAPGTGKSTIAMHLAKKMGIYQLIGTDTIREILRKCLPEKNFPSLHTSAILFCDQAPENEDKNIYGFQKQAEDVLVGVQAVIDRSIKENKDLIIEGIHLIPGLVKPKEDVEIINIVITVEDNDQHMKQLSGQGKNRSAYKIDNLSKARKFQDYLVIKAKENNIKIIVNNQPLDQLFSQINI